MSLLQTIHRGIRPMPPRLLIYGTEGIGKSTFAASSWAPIFIATEKGLNQIDCASFPLAASVEEVFNQLAALINEDHDYQTVAIDTLDWLEKLIWERVAKNHGKENIEDIDYAKGYTLALSYWSKFLNQLDILHERGMAVILLAHAKIEKFQDPENPAYDRYSPRLHKHAMGLVCEWCDSILFANKKMVIKKDGTGFRERKLAVGVGTNGGDRVLRCEGGPTCIAKNRYGMPLELPLVWEAVEPYLTQSTATSISGAIPAASAVG